MSDFQDYLSLAENDIKNYITETTVRLDNYLPQKLFLGFENDYEFIRGWTLGQIQASCIDLFREVFGRPPTKEEYQKIVQLIIKYANDIQKEIETFYSSIKS